MMKGRKMKPMQKGFLNVLEKLLGAGLVTVTCVQFLMIVGKL